MQMGDLGGWPWLVIEGIWVLLIEASGVVGVGYSSRWFKLVVLVVRGWWWWWRIGKFSGGRWRVVWPFSVIFFIISAVVVVVVMTEGELHYC